MLQIQIDRMNLCLSEETLCLKIHYRRVSVISTYPHVKLQMRLIERQFI